MQTAESGWRVMVGIAEAWDGALYA